MHIFLTDQVPAAGWNQNALISSHDKGINIHVGARQQDLSSIQRAARKIALLEIDTAELQGAGWNLDAQWAFAKGFISPKQQARIIWAPLPNQERDELQNRFQTHRWVQTQINKTPEEKSPLEFAATAAEFVKSYAPNAVDYEIISNERLLAEGWVGVHGVGRGSARPPVILKLEYCPAECKNQPVAIALVGKGIVFDSGGYSLKTSEQMFLMKSDMGGAATLAGALALAISRGLKKRVVMILCCAENLVSGHAYKVGDILTYKNGVSVEIANTDAEGRLILADGLLMAAETGASLIIDAATLTGAAIVALGTHYNAIFALDRELQNRALHYSEQVHELHWPLPLEPWHQQECPSHYAHTANSRPVHGGGPGGASNAAGFLSRFVPRQGKGWLHFDLAAAFHKDSGPLYAAGASAQGLLTIAKILHEEN